MKQNISCGRILFEMLFYAAFYFVFRISFKEANQNLFCLFTRILFTDSKRKLLEKRQTLSTFYKSESLRELRRRERINQRIVEVCAEDKEIPVHWKTVEFFGILVDGTLQQHPRKVTRSLRKLLCEMHRGTSLRWLILCTNLIVLRCTESWLHIISECVCKGISGRLAFALIK